MRRKYPMDEGYAWVVMAASFGIEFVNGVLVGGVGMITTAILEEVDPNLTTVSWVSATMLATFSLFGPFAGVIQDKLGHRVTGIIGGLFMLTGLTAASFCRSVTGLILTYGIITGVGVGLSVNVSGVAPGSYFNTRMAVAYGVAMCGGGLGIFAVGPMTVYLLEAYTLSGTLLMLGAISFHVTLFSALIRPNPVSKYSDVQDIIIEIKDDGPFTEATSVSDSANGYVDEITTSDYLEDTNTSEGKPEKDIHVPSASANLLPPSTNASTVPQHDIAIVNILRKCVLVLTQNGFYLFALSIAFLAVGESACMVHMPNYFEHKGSTASQAAQALTATGLSGVASGLLAGLAASDRSIGPLLLYVGAQGCTGVANTLLPLYSHAYPLQLLFGSLYGFYSNVPYSLLSPICIELAGLTNLAIAYGLILVALGIGFLVGGPVASLLYETSGVYDYTFVFSGCSYITSAVCAVCIPMSRKHEINT